MEEIARRYGEALFSLALEKGKVNEYQSETKTWEDIFNENKEIYSLLGSKFLSKDERKEKLKKISKGMNDDILSFFMVVIDNDRVDHMRNIFIAFNSYCNDYKKVKEGIIYSTIHLDKETISKINEKISKLENQNVDLRNVIDKTLIGGIKVVVSDHVYDDSIKFHLEQMKTTLLKKEDITDEN